MNNFSIAVMMLCLLSAPSQAAEATSGNFFSQLFGSATAAQHQTSGHGGRHADGDRTHRHAHQRAHVARHNHMAAHSDWRASVPAGGRSFVASASYYGGGPRRFEPNTHTANGENFNQWGLTAAHRTLPMGTRLLVSHGGRSVVVRVNDRGPAAWTGRSLDLSRGAASAIGLISSGTGAVRVTVLGRG